MAIKRIIICGKGASGKDYLRKRLENKGYEFAVSYTTRPPREGETEGYSYYFVSDEEFTRMVEEDLWYEWVEFNGWKYGTTKEQFERCSVFIMTPKGLSHLKEEHRKESFVIYLDIPVLTRIERLNARIMPGDSMYRRLNADEEDFKDFTNFDLRVTDERF
jgi:guanylate kinase